MLWPFGVARLWAQRTRFYGINAWLATTKRLDSPPTCPFVNPQANSTVHHRRKIQKNSSETRLKKAVDTIRCAPALASIKHYKNLKYQEHYQLSITASTGFHRLLLRLLNYCLLWHFTKSFLNGVLTTGHCRVSTGLTIIQIYPVRTFIA